MRKPPFGVYDATNAGIAVTQEPRTMVTFLLPVSAANEMHPGQVVVLAWAGKRAIGSRILHERRWWKR